jgi:hypothetical protein
MCFKDSALQAKARPHMKRILRLALTSVWLILLVALVARLGYARVRSRETPEHILSSIPFLYEPSNIAFSIAIGQGFSSPLRANTGPTAWTTPVYPYLLAGIFQIFGTYTYHAFAAAILLNITCSALTCVPIFFAGRRIAGLQMGALAAWLWALFPNAVIIPFEWIWDTSLSALLAASLLWATLKLDAQSPKRIWCGYGLLWGAALLTNAALISLLPFLLGWLAFKSRKSAGALRGPALALVITALTCAPWTVRNYRMLHAFVPLRSALGVQLWVGNNDQYRDRFPAWLHPLDNSFERERYAQLGEIEYMREKQSQAIHYIFTHPAKEARLFYKRFLGIWFGSDTPLRELMATRSWLVRVAIVSNMLAALGALCGAVALFRAKNEFAFPLFVFALVFPVPFYLSQALLRYRHPIDPAVMLLAAAGLLAGLVKLKRPRMLG